jgi:hypothetical protein
VLKAAAWIAAGTRFAVKVRREELEPEVVGSVPLCTSQYRQLLAASRIPQPAKYVPLVLSFTLFLSSFPFFLFSALFIAFSFFPFFIFIYFVTLLKTFILCLCLMLRDKFVVYPNSRHVAVLSGGNFYKVFVLDEAGKPLPENQIVDSLLDIQRVEKVRLFISLFCVTLCLLFLFLLNYYYSFSTFVMCCMDRFCFLAIPLFSSFRSHF